MRRAWASTGRPFSWAERGAALSYLYETRARWAELELRYAMNLLSNAAKFTAQGEIGVSAQVVAGALQIAVSDTGIGIATKYHGLIFEAFR